MLFFFTRTAFAEGCVYAKVDSIGADSVYIAICNSSNDTVCLHTGFLNSPAARPHSTVDQMLYLHRYDKKCDSNKVSFVPIMPFMRYSSHMPVRKICYPDEPWQALTFEFRLIAPHAKFAYPISKKALIKKEYIQNYDPLDFPFYNILARNNNDKSLAKHAEYKPYIGKLHIEEAPDLNTNWIIIEFAIYTQFDIITCEYFEKQVGTSSKWESFYLNPYECNDQLHKVKIVSLLFDIQDL